MKNLDDIRADAERSLALRIKRIEHTNPSGKIVGTKPDLEAAEQFAARAEVRLYEARSAHAKVTSEAQAFADIVTQLGGVPELPEGFTVALVPDVSPVQSDDDEFPQPNDDDDTDTVLSGTDEDTEVQDDTPVETGPVRIGGRFAKRGSVV
jgi:hypothetical protein